MYGSHALGYSSARVNIFQDLVILVIPIPWLIKLTCSIGDKIQIIGMFSVGDCKSRQFAVRIILIPNSVCICSIIRTTKLPSFTAATKNPTRGFAEPMYWTAIEIYVAIITPSLPPIRSFLSYHLPRLFPSRTSPQSVHLQNVPPQHSYQRTRSLKDSSANTGSTFASLATTRGQHRSVGGERAEAEGRDEWLELGDRTRGTVHAGVVSGGYINDDSNINGNGAWKWHNEGGGIVVSTATHTVVQTVERSWLDDIEIGLGLEKRESWKVFRQGEWV